MILIGTFHIRAVTQLQAASLLKNDILTLIRIQMKLKGFSAAEATRVVCVVCLGAVSFTKKDLSAFCFGWNQVLDLNSYVNNGI